MTASDSIPEFSRVVLTQDLTDEGLKAGDVGTVVDVYRSGAGCEIEFFTLTGDTLTVATVIASQVRPVADGEVANARRLGN